MSDLYSEARDDVSNLSQPLFAFAESQVRELGAFLPFGATLKQEGKVALNGATDGADEASPEEILPILHAGLRAEQAAGALAVAACEWVSIQPDGSQSTDAIKVQLEHQNGLSLALYLPMSQDSGGRWASGKMLAIASEPEIGR